MSRTLSNIDRVEHSTFMLRDGAPMTPMSDHACLADAMGLLSVEDVDALLPLYEPVYRDGLLRQRIRTMVIEGRLEDAHATAELMATAANAGLHAVPALATHRRALDTHARPGTRADAEHPSRAHAASVRGHGPVRALTSYDATSITRRASMAATGACATRPSC